MAENLKEYIPVTFENNSVLKISKKEANLTLADSKKYTDGVRNGLQNSINGKADSGRVGTLENKYTQIKATADGLSNTVAKHTSSIGSLDTRMGSAENRISQKVDTSTFNQKSDEIASTVKSVQNNTDAQISAIRQTAKSLSFKVGTLQREGGNILPGGNVNGLFNKKYSVFVSGYFTVEEGKTYTVTANVYKDTSGSHVIDIIAFCSDWSRQYRGRTSETDSSNIYCYSFTAGATEQLRVGFYERTASNDDPGSYEGVHLNWVRVDEGDWTGEARLSEWGPSDRETDAVNLLPDPSFSHGIGFTDGMGERNSYADGMGDTVSWMSGDASADGDGCHAVLFNRSSSSQTSSGIRYLIPFRGTGTYYLSYVYTDLSRTDSSYPGMTAILSAECHPCDADGNRITGGFGVYSKNTSSEDSGIIRCGQPYTFGATATNGSGTRKDVVYLEVRVFLSQRGAVRVSRICLSKSDHYIYWNANAVNESRKNDAKLLATGVDIEAGKITATGDKFEWRDNRGNRMAYLEAGSGADDSTLHLHNIDATGKITATSGRFGGLELVDRFPDESRHIDVSDNAPSFRKSYISNEDGLLFTTFINNGSGQNNTFSFVQPAGGPIPYRSAIPAPNIVRGLSAVHMYGYDASVPAHTSVISNPKVSDTTVTFYNYGIGYLTNGRSVARVFQTTSGGLALIAVGGGKVSAWGNVLSTLTLAHNASRQDFSFSANRRGTGVYRITYSRSVPGNLWVMAHPVMDNDNPMYASVTAQDSSGCTVKTADDNSTNDCDFEFLVVTLGSGELG